MDEQDIYANVEGPSGPHVKWEREFRKSSENIYQNEDACCSVETNRTGPTLSALHSQEWKYFSGSFYYISSTTKSWKESRKDCLQKKSDLVIIKSPEEQEFIRSWKKRTWIGLTDAETERTWKWVDGTLLGSPRYWAESEPNNEGNEDCGEIRKFDSQNSWNDVMCNLENHWICEIELSNHLQLTGQK